MTLTITAEMIGRTEQEWSRLAGEPVRVENISGTLYAFGSELACLRLFHKFHGSKTIKAAYSDNLKSWYFSNETMFR